MNFQPEIYAILTSKKVSSHLDYIFEICSNLNYIKKVIQGSFILMDKTIFNFLNDEKKTMKERSTIFLDMLKKSEEKF